jgi:hypothetical protein
MALLNPTEQEEKTLSVVIEDLDKKTELQRAVCLCLIRGDDTHEKIGQTLGISADDVRAALRDVWGVLYDRTRDKLWIK